MHLRLYQKFLLAITLLFGLTGQASVAFNKIGVRCAISTRRKWYQFQKRMQLCVNPTHIDQLCDLRLRHLLGWDGERLFDLHHATPCDRPFDLHCANVRSTFWVALCNAVRSTFRLASHIQLKSLTRKHLDSLEQDSRRNCILCRCRRQKFFVNRIPCITASNKHFWKPRELNWHSCKNSVNFTSL